MNMVIERMNSLKRSPLVEAISRLSRERNDGTDIIHLVDKFALNWPTCISLNKEDRMENFQQKRVKQKTVGHIIFRCLSISRLGPNALS